MCVGTQRYRRLLPSHAEASEWEARTRLRLLRGATSVSHPQLTLEELFQRTLHLHWAGTRSEATSTINAQDVVSLLGPSRPVASVGLPEVQGLIVALKARGNSASTINRKLAALSKMLGVAEEAGIIERRPKLPRLKESEHRTRFLTLEEERALFTAIGQRGHPDVRDLCVFLVETGLRVGEARRLRWSDCDKGAVTVRGSKADTPRTVPLTAEASRVLDERRGAPTPWGHISQNRLQYIWNLARADVGLEGDSDVVPHILRHTCASRLVQQGVGILIVQQWLGHRTLLQTMRYAHLATRALNGAREALDQLREEDD